MRTSSDGPSQPSSLHQLNTPKKQRNTVNRRSDSVRTYVDWYRTDGCIPNPFNTSFVFAATRNLNKQT
uniref:Uncharacterized protein n=1 Tax=Romanomermis culicivorax TaxID=13658 RepID=A0A915K8T5_ROMCU